MSFKQFFGNFLLFEHGQNSQLLRCHNNRLSFVIVLGNDLFTLPVIFVFSFVRTKRTFEFDSYTLRISGGVTGLTDFQYVHFPLE